MNKSSPPAPILRYDDLLALFVESCKPRANWRIGPEIEKHGVDQSTLRPVLYGSDRGVLRILEELAAKHGWTAEVEREGGPIVSLKRGGGSITLEPGAQLELSGRAAENVHEIRDELYDHMREIGPISRELGIVWLGLGFHPFAQRSEFEWVPKARYPIMREYLPTKGAYALDMMLRTCTVQANYDYGSEDDAMRKMRVALALAPLTTALFANSPWREGKSAGAVSWRARIWLEVDPDRSGLLPMLWKKNAAFRDYVEWALDAPMFLFKRGDRIVANTGQPFRSFMKDGFEGAFPTRADWQLHINTLFPEVRLKNTLEIRGADAQSLALAPALPALFTGIFYDDRALDGASALIESWTYDEVVSLRQQIWKTGLRTTFRGEPLARVAEQVLALAMDGLARRGCVRKALGDERVYLAPLAALAERGLCPADELLKGLDSSLELAPQVIERAAIEESE